MTTSNISGVRIAGISCSVPEPVGKADDFAEAFGSDQVGKISASTGVQKWHYTTDDVCTSDLCYSAADRLLNDLSWDRESIDLLVFVTQGPDHIIPATACILQDRLKLSSECASFDMVLGCSAYVYGIWLVSSLLTAGGFNRALLLVGDASRKAVSPQDRSTALLFGDAGSATAMESCDGTSAISFALGTDGKGSHNLVVPAGGDRFRFNSDIRELKKRKDGNLRSDIDLYMNGPEIFSFTLREVKPMVNEVMQASGWAVDDVDAFVMHQANKFIIEFLAKKMKLPLEKVPQSLKDFGNTSCASIPLTMIHCHSDQLKEKSLNLILAGFGVGYSWGACALSCGPMVVSEIVIHKPEKSGGS